MFEKESTNSLCFCFSGSFKEMQFPLHWHENQQISSARWWWCNWNECTVLTKEILIDIPGIASSVNVVPLHILTFSI